MKGYPMGVRALAVGLTLVGFGVPSVGRAQVRVEVGIPLPGFELQIGGPLVYVGPGVWVLPDSRDEVFYNNGYYWARTQNHWYRSRGRQGGWGVVEDRYVPLPVMRVPPGRYRDYHAPEHARRMAPPGWAKQDKRREARELPQPRARMQMQPRGGAPQQPGPRPMQRNDDRPRGRGQGQGGGGGHGGGRGR